MTIDQGQKNRFYLVTVLYWFALYIYIPILGPFVELLGGSLRMVGLVVGSYGIAQMLLRVPLGIYSDAIQKRRIFISLGLFLALISSLGVGLSTSPWSALAFRALSGSAAATWVTFTVLFSSYFPKQDAAKAMGIIMFYTFLGQMIATSTGGFIADSFGWHAPFILGGGVGFIGLLLSTKLHEPAMEKKTLNSKELLQVGKDSHLLAVSLLAILFQSLTYSTVYGFNPMYAVSIGATKSQLSILAFVSSAPTAIAALKIGKLTDMLGERNLLLIGFSVFAVCSGVIPFIERLDLLYATQILAGIARGCIFPILMGMSIINVSGSKRATAMGFFQSLYALGMFIGPVFVGYIGDVFSLRDSFLTVGLMGILATILTYKLIPSTEKIKPTIHSQT